MKRAIPVWAILGITACEPQNLDLKSDSGADLEEVTTIAAALSDTAELDDTGSFSDDDTDAHTDDDTDTEPEPTRPDPFAPRTDTTEGLVNADRDLMAVLEDGRLQGARDRYAADPTNRRKELLCGKEMFFYEGFGTEAFLAASSTSCCAALTTRSLERPSRPTDWCPIPPLPTATPWAWPSLTTSRAWSSPARAATSPPWKTVATPLVRPTTTIGTASTISHLPCSPSSPPGA